LSLGLSRCLPLLSLHWSTRTTRTRWNPMMEKYGRRLRNWRRLSWWRDCLRSCWRHRSRMRPYSLYWNIRWHWLGMRYWHLCRIYSRELSSQSWWLSLSLSLSLWRSARSGWSTRTRYLIWRQVARRRTACNTCRRSHLGSCGRLDSRLLMYLSD